MAIFIELVQTLYHVLKILPVFLMNKMDSSAVLFIHSFDQQLNIEDLLYVLDIHQMKWGKRKDNCNTTTIKNKLKK